jgi:hypothetical protein
MKKGVNFLGKTILFSAIISMGFMANYANAQPGGRGGNGNHGGPARSGGSGGGRDFGGNRGGAGNFGGGSHNGSRNNGGNQPGRNFSSGDRGSFGRGNDAPRQITQNRNFDRRPEQNITRRPQQIVNGNRPIHNGPGRSPVVQQRNYPGRNLAYNHRPVQVRGNYGRPNVHINIGLGASYRYNPRFYYGGGYHYRPYYYRPFVAPTFGFRINVLPVGYYSFYWGSIPYYFYDGAYYRYYNNYYEVVEPPLGAKLPTLPAGAEAVIIDGETYYEYKGTYYQKTYGENGDTLYEVVGTDGVLETDKAVQGELEHVQQNGDIFYQLPEGTKTLGLDGKTYYVSPGGDYYEQYFDKDGNAYYMKVASQSI